MTESANGPRTNHAAVPDRAHMTDTATSTGRADSAVPTTYNVIAVAFEDVNAYAALTKLKELDAQGQVAVIDAAMGALGGTVTRRSVADVEAEIAAVEEAQRKAARAAQQELMRARGEQTREAAHAKVEALKPRLACRGGATRPTPTRARLREPRRAAGTPVATQYAR